MINKKVDDAETIELPKKWLTSEFHNHDYGHNRTWGEVQAFEIDCNKGREESFPLISGFLQIVCLLPFTDSDFPLGIFKLFFLYFFANFSKIKGDKDRLLTWFIRNYNEFLFMLNTTHCFEIYFTSISLKYWMFQEERGKRILETKHTHCIKQKFLLFHEKLISKYQNIFERTDIF